VLEPEKFGRYPVRTELTVLSADDPGPEPIGWIVKTYNGTEVYLISAPEVPLTTKASLQVGSEVLVTTLVGVYQMIVHQEANGTLYATTGPTVSDLKFDVDDRHCWVSTYAINTRGIARLAVKK